MDKIWSSEHMSTEFGSDGDDCHEILATSIGEFLRTILIASGSVVAVGAGTYLLFAGIVYALTTTLF